MISPALDQLAESLYQGGAIKAGTLRGKEIPGLPKGVRALIALDSSDKLHLLFSPADVAQSSRLRTVQLRNVRCSVERWEVGGSPLGDYVDIVCDADRASPLRKPFAGFCEDVLKTLGSGRNSIPDAVLSTFKRWKRFWDLPRSKGLKDEWLKGLFGELVFLEGLIEQCGSTAVSSWCGPDGNDHDFRNGSIAVEVKTTSTDPPTVRIHTLRQLDDTDLDVLYLYVVGLSKGDGGVSVVDVVERVENSLAGDSAAQDLFWSKLAQAGYRRDLEPQYRQRLLTQDRSRIYRVADEFPRIVSSSFRSPPDDRISKLRYVLSLAGVSERPLTDREVIGHIKKLG